MTSPSIPTKHEQGTRAEPVDFQLMLELWTAESGRERCRKMALEMADRNRENARSERK